MEWMEWDGLDASHYRNLLFLSHGSLPHVSVPYAQCRNMVCQERTEAWLYPLCHPNETIAISVLPLSIFIEYLPRSINTIFNLLANNVNKNYPLLHLHSFCLETWFEKSFNTSCRGKAYLLRYADESKSIKPAKSSLRKHFMHSSPSSLTISQHDKD